MILTSTRDPRTRARFGEAMTQNLAPGQPMDCDLFPVVWRRQPEAA